MPSGSQNHEPPARLARPHALPWYMDALRCGRWLSAPRDRAAIDLVRHDLAEDLRELRAAGWWRARAVVARKVVRECGFFWPRAVAWRREQVKVRVGATLAVCRRPTAMVAKPVVAVGLSVVALVGAAWWVIDRQAVESVADLVPKLREERQRLTDAANDLHAIQGERPTSGIDAMAEQLIGQLEASRDRLERTQRGYPEELWLTGLIGTADEEIALYWESRGDPERALAYWRGALDRYSTGARYGDPVALFQLGKHHLDAGRLLEARGVLQRAYHEWPRLRIPEESQTGQVMAEYHYCLVELWKQTGLRGLVAEIREIEDRALELMSHGTPQELTFQVLYNGACCRLQMAARGDLDPTEGLAAVGLIEKALESSGEDASSVARWVLTDPDLDVIRDSPVFENLEARARALMK